MGRCCPAERVAAWNVDTWADFVPLRFNVDGPATVTPSVVAGRGRLTGQAGAANGNYREAFLRRGTRWGDSEVRSLWWGGSVSDGAVCTPQMGHVHRANIGPDGLWHAYVIDCNIFGPTPPDRFNLRVWQTDTVTLALGSNPGATTMTEELDRGMQVTAVTRFEFPPGTWLNRYTVNPPPQRSADSLAAGDLVTVDAELDATFDETAVAIAAVGSPGGTVTVVEATTLAAVASKFENGTMVPAATHRRFWPYWMASQLEGTVLRLKAWRYTDPEPDWASTTNVASIDTAGANNPSPTAIAPVGPGLCGVLAAHLRNSAYIEYGDIEFRRL